MPAAKERECCSTGAAWACHLRIEPRPPWARASAPFRPSRAGACGHGRVLGVGATAPPPPLQARLASMSDCLRPRGAGRLSGDAPCAAHAGYKNQARAMCADFGRGQRRRVRRRAFASLPGSSSPASTPPGARAAAKGKCKTLRAFACSPPVIPRCAGPPPEPPLQTPRPRLPRARDAARIKFGVPSPSATTRSPPLQPLAHALRKMRDRRHFSAHARLLPLHPQPFPRLHPHAINFSIFCPLTPPHAPSPLAVPHARILDGHP